MNPAILRAREIMHNFRLDRDRKYHREENLKLFNDFLYCCDCKAQGDRTKYPKEIMSHSFYYVDKRGIKHYKHKCLKHSEND